MSCELCDHEAPGWTEVARDSQLRVLRVLDAPDFPAFYRVAWLSHAPEFSDLSAVERGHCMEVVATVERVLREALKPTKINLAALGNVTPHLHWHVIARFDWDSHYPQPIWGLRQREVQPPALQRLPLPLTALDERVRQALRGG
jgi:diadenosine tetraphosphate (Ap4A) HIT family hydrolase